MKKVPETSVVDVYDRFTYTHHTKVFNVNLFGPTLHVHLPLLVCKDFRLMGVYENDVNCPVGHYEYNNGRWIDIPVDCLNLDTGYHQYLVEFINNVTADTLYLYFSYMIQNDDPDKPYIYMNR